MRIWIDADACPGPIRDIVLRASQRLKVPVTFVANKKLVLPDSELISVVHVEQGPDIADAYIAEHVKRNDLVVTQDIPLAAQLVPLGASVLSPRGDKYTEANISEHLSWRDLMTELRDTGSVSGGPKPFDEKVKRAFANHFDSELNRLLRLESKT
ncbi:MAG: YaiI/YqxD family protein [Candidatus Obscuribacterales bacterium]|nr:YaiI/YqxD family protein [Cyanobacteria bacterium SZAS LIN-5]RTL36367.1 MAG: YaiI/YqxD family protein [Candidatus Melainabacteria bacterium]